MKKVISFSIFGDVPKYCIGMLRNLELSKKVFPEWDVYIYFNNTVPSIYLDRYKKFNHVTLIDMSNERIPGMFWRFLPLEGVERFICRDSDSRLIDRDKAAVDEWIKDGTDIHIMRDHDHHHYRILGGMWGLRPKENLLPLIKNYISNKNKNLFERMVDMDFLRDVIYPKYITNSTIHVSLSKNIMEKNYKPFPKKIIDYRFVGEIINEDESREYQYTIWKNNQEL